jgi:hypothetical protein
VRAVDRTGARAPVAASFFFTTSASNNVSARSKIVATSPFGML